MSRRSRAHEKQVAKAAAAKQRRQKVIAFAGLGVLAILLFIQLPKLLGGSDRLTVDAVPGAPSGSTSETKRIPTRTLRLLQGSGADPFASRPLADIDSRAAAVAGPGGARDPFAAAVAAAPTPVATPAAQPKPVATPVPGEIVVGTRKPGAVAKRGWIVVLASIQTRSGRALAQRFATRMRRNGLGSVSVLDSSTNKPLRSGYYVVYTGPFASLGAVKRSAAHIRALGYRTAYVREIVRY